MNAVRKEGSLLHFLILLHCLEEGPCIQAGLFNAQHPPAPTTKVA